MKYWFGYLTAAIFGAITWVLMQFGEKFATLGGNVSTNAGGMRAVKYGATRDYVRALTVVMPNGEIQEFGGKVAKNSSARYALCEIVNIHDTALEFEPIYRILFGVDAKAIIDASPFHTSMVVSNLASIRTNHIFHHIYDFGTCGQIITIGNSELRPKQKGKEIVFENDNLLASGVLMEAKSVEDDGEDILFCVYCYNVQPGVVINYEDGSSILETN